MNKQETIYSKNQKFLHYFKQKGNTAFLIPDTSSAKEKARLEGAQFFSTYKFCRYDRHSFPQARKWGDLYIRFSYTRLTVMEEAFHQFKSLIPDLFYQILGIDNLNNIKIIMLEGEGYGLSVPARLLQLAQGHPLLPEIYQYLTIKFQEYYSKANCIKYFQIWLANLTDIENVKHGDKYKIPLAFQDFFSKTYNELQILSNDRQEYIEKSPNIMTIDSQTLKHLKHHAQKIYIKEKEIKFLIKECDLFKTIIEKSYIPEEERTLINFVINSFDRAIRYSLLGKLNEKKEETGKIRFQELTHDIFGNAGTICQKVRDKKLCFNKQCKKNSPVEIIVGWEPIISLNMTQPDFRKVQTHKCAISILRKIFNHGIFEFTERDAHRLVRGSFSTIHEVNSALQLLEKHNFLTRFELGDYSYLGRRPGPWFLLNKLWDGKLF